MLLQKSFNSCVLKGELILRKYYFCVRAVEVLWAACSALFLSSKQTCLDFYLPDSTPISLLIVLFWMFLSKLFLSSLTQNTRKWAMKGSSSTVVLSPDYTLESLGGLLKILMPAQPLQLPEKAKNHCLVGGGFDFLITPSKAPLSVCSW